MAEAAYLSFSRIKGVTNLFKRLFLGKHFPGDIFSFQVSNGFCCFVRPIRFLEGLCFAETFVKACYRRNLHSLLITIIVTTIILIITTYYRLDNKKPKYFWQRCSFKN